ncbi:hypothetical protein MKW94_005650 [Papaver nudicaule]|uniref:Uncharacterized protein n=1 Tax=Papaver nudicaule TaxID=74823 RepID=A0AA41SE14_PAPNU|nr:hypothetical protein [Papaver nudicaule]
MLVGLTGQCPNSLIHVGPSVWSCSLVLVKFLDQSVGHLVSAMKSVVSNTGFILLGYKIRSPEAHKLFWELCENVFLFEKVPHEDLHPEYAYEEAYIYVMMKKMTN